MYIPIKDCVTRRVYKIDSRNLSYGVYDGKEGFIGIRNKFGSRFLFTEFHYDQGPPFGTVKPLEDLGINLPEDIKLEEYLGSVDKDTGKEVYYVKQPNGSETEYGDGWGWAFWEGKEFSKEISPMAVNNKDLFDFMESVYKKFS